jgi:hypothetical protein
MPTFLRMFQEQYVTMTMFLFSDYSQYSFNLETAGFAANAGRWLVLQLMQGDSWFCN